MGKKMKKKPKCVYRKRQWSRQAARKMAKMWRRDAKRVARCKKIRRYIGFGKKRSPISENSTCWFPALKYITERISKRGRVLLCKSYIKRAILAEAYAGGHMLQLRQINGAGNTVGWRDECNPLYWLGPISYESLRVKPEYAKSIGKAIPARPV